jgi:hypothetical protein
MEFVESLLAFTLFDPVIIEHVSSKFFELNRIDTPKSAYQLYDH